MTLFAQHTLQSSMGLPKVGERDRYAHVMSSGLADACLNTGDGKGPKGLCARHVF
jgi:hypothetical protein